MRRFLLLVLSTCWFAEVGCGGSSNGTTSGAATSNIVITTSLARADVDAGNFFTVSSYATGDTTGGGSLVITLAGAGSITTTGPGLFADYTTTYTAPGSPTTVNATSIAGTSATLTVASKTDSSRSVAIPIALHDNINFPPQALPGAFVGKPYTYTFTGSGGTGTLSWSTPSTSAPLPAGLALSATGVLAGTPTTMGTYGVQVLVVDQATKVIGIARTVSITVS